MSRVSPQKALKSLRSRLPSWLLPGIAIGFLLALGLHLAAILALKQVAERLLHPPQDVGTHFGAVDLNLFSGRLAVSDFVLRRDAETWLRFKQLALEVRPLPLLIGEIRLRPVLLEGAYLRIERRQDGAFDLPFPLPAGDDSGEAGTPLDLELEGVALGKLEIDYRDGDQRSVLWIEKLETAGYGLRLGDQQIGVTLLGRWDDAPLQLDGSLAVSSTGIALDLQRLELSQQLDRLAALGRTGLDLHGRIGLQGSLQAGAERVQYRGSLEVGELAFNGPDLGVQLAEFRLPQGDVSVLPGERLEVDGAFPEGLTLRQLAVTAPDLALRLQQLEAGGMDLHYDPEALRRGGDLRLTGLQLEAGGRQLEMASLTLPDSELQWLSGPPSRLQLKPRAAEAVALQDFRYAEEALELTLAGLGLPLQSLQLELAGQPSGEVLLDAGTRLEAVGARLPTLSLGLAELALSAPLRLDLRADGVALQSPGEVAAVKMDVTLLPHEIQVAGEQLSLGGFELAGGRIQLGALAARMLQLNQERRNYRLESLDLSGLTLDPQQGLELGALRMAGIDASFVRDASGEFQQFLAFRAVDESREDTSLRWSIDSYEIGDAHLRFSDRKAVPNVDWEYQLESLRVGALATAQPDRDTPVALLLKPDQYSQLALEGVVRPLAQPFQAKLKGDLTGYGLASLNPYVEEAMRHIFLQGQLADEFGVEIEGGRISMTNALEIRRLEVEPKPGPKGESGPPLSLGIALLEDKEGVIRLELPISGDLANPDFKVMAAINELIVKGIAGAAAVGLAPVGTVAALGAMLAKGALEVSFPPVRFAPQQAQPDAKAREYLAQLKSKLAERPKLRVRLCGVASKADGPPPPAKPQDGKAQTQTEAPPLDEKPLLELAQQRADQVRQTLRDAGLAESQLRACRPRVDLQEGAEGRVEIGL